MKYILIFVVLLLNYSCRQFNRTFNESSEMSTDTQTLDSLEKVLPIDERVGCNDTLGISLRPEYSVYPMGTKRVRFFLCNNSGMEICFGANLRVTYQDKRGTWRILPFINYSVPDVLNVVQTGDYRFLNCPLDSDVPLQGSGRYRCFYPINWNGKDLIFMGECRLTNMEKSVRNVPFYISIDSDNPVKASDKMNIEEKQDSVFRIAEVMPEFPGGMDKLLPFIEKSIQYPQQALKNEVQGRVIVHVIIEKDGSFTDCRIVRSVDPYLDKEAIRIAARVMPKWKPGKQDGKPVRVEYTFPVCFRIVPPMK